MKAFGVARNRAAGSSARICAKMLYAITSREYSVREPNMSERWDGLLLDCRLATLRNNGQPYGAIEHAALGWKDGKITFAAAASSAAGQAGRIWRHTSSRWRAHGSRRAGRLPHASGIRRQSRARIRFASEWRELRRHRPCRRRHRLDGRGRVRRARTNCSRNRAARARAAGRWRDHAGNQVRLRAGSGSETKMLRVARRIGSELGIGVRTTFLGAHALPPEFAGRQSDYVDEVCVHMLPASRRRRTGRCGRCVLRNIAFTRRETRRVFETARAWGCRSSCMRTSCRISAARRWPRNSARCRPIIWNTPAKPACARWLPPAPWP